MIRVGLVDFDTSHVVEFTRILNHIELPASRCVDGAKVVAGFPGDSDMMPERIPGYRAKLEGFGLQMVESPEEMAPMIDAVMIESQQGSRHLERARHYLELGIPVFVDKPFANSLQDADKMIALAGQHGSPLMSASALRYDPTIEAAKAAVETMGHILGVDVYCPCALHPGNPGFLNYGIHGIEMLYALMGPGCAEVRCHRTEGADLVVAIWNGIPSTLRGIRQGKYGFGMTVHYEQGHAQFEIVGSEFYSGLMRAFVRMCETMVAPIPLPETREIIAFCVAAEKSAAELGKPVTLG